MAYYLSEINARCRADAAGFIAECDGIYADRLELAADRIMENMEKSPIVLLSGPSGSGKTTTALKICEVLERRGVRTHSISMDNYFKSVSPETTPRTPEGKYDLESPLCMDMELLNEHFSVLSEGGRILVPRYDFVHQCRDLEPSASLRLKKNEVAVFEGIHALNDSITLVHPEAFKLYISARSNILDDDGAVVFKGTWMRLMRRTVRDYLFRGTAAQETLAHWRSCISRPSRTRRISSSTRRSPTRCRCSTTPPPAFSTPCPPTRRATASCRASSRRLSALRTSRRSFLQRTRCCVNSSAAESIRTDRFPGPRRNTREKGRIPPMPQFRDPNEKARAENGAAVHRGNARHERL